jgi:hypothetical protein
MFRLLLGALCCIQVVVGQQYVGQAVPNSLDARPGAQIAYFNVKDSLGRNTTLINYYSAPGGKRPVNKQVQRAIISIPGANRNADGYFSAIYNQIATAKKSNTAITEDTVVILSPML